MSLRELQIVLVGGSGGLGMASARMLAEAGAKLVVTYNRDSARARELSPIAEIIQADITRPEDRARLLNVAANVYGLVVFVGMPARAPEDWDQSLRVNYTGPIHLARETAARMKQKGTAGAIVLIATMQAAALFPSSTSYAGAKAALVHAGRILAKEVRGPQEVRVNIISPGVMNAGMAAASIQSGKYDRFLKEGFIPRWGTGKDIARAVSLFLEPDSYITGQHLIVDGGLSL